MWTCLLEPLKYLPIIGRYMTYYQSLLHTTKPRLLYNKLQIQCTYQKPRDDNIKCTASNRKFICFFFCFSASVATTHARWLSRPSCILHLKRKYDRPKKNLLARARRWKKVDDPTVRQVQNKPKIFNPNLVCGLFDLGFLVFSHRVIYISRGNTIGRKRTY